MLTIEVDFDVYKALTARREAEAVTHNDVLRRLLNLGQASTQLTTNSSAAASSDDWFTKGVRFPAGTDFRAKYKGELHFGKVENGHLVVNGQTSQSPSEAAALITRNNVNGWDFWECRLPGENVWQPINALRRNLYRTTSTAPALSSITGLSFKSST